MINNPSNINYSRALLELSLENNTIDKVYLDISEINSTLKGNESILKSLKMPFLTFREKMSIFIAIFKKESKDNVISNFFELLFKKYKEKEILNILDTFQDLVLLEKGLKKVKIKSAERITESQKEAISLKLGLSINNVIFEEEIDLNLIGGFVLIYEGKIYDASLKRKLLDIRNKINF